MNKNQTEQPNPYRIDRLAMIPVPVKAVLIKYWFAGAVYFFIGQGIASLNTIDQLDLVLVLGIVLGMVMNVFVSNIYRYLETDKPDFAPYMVFRSKKLYVFFLDIVYNIVLSFIIAYTYNTINLLAIHFGWVGEGGVWLTAEPLLYGLFYLLYDYIVLGIKALVRKLRNL